MSALAARRAAQAARVSQSAAPAPSTTAVAAPPRPSPSPSRTPSLVSSPEPAQPAQPAQAARRRAPASGKKRRASSPVPPPANRYFAPPEPAPAPEAGPSRRGKRARRFSPSAPAEEAASTSGSDDEDGEGDAGYGAGTPFTPWTGSPPDGDDVSRLALAAVSATSTYAPLPGVNLHILEAAGLDAAGLAEPSAVISLDATDTLVLAGIFTVQPLLGAVRMLSTTLVPGTAHPVFAPTSHPLPVLRAAPTAARSALLDRLALPRTFAADAGRSVFLLSEHRTGVERLGGSIVPGFSNVWVGAGGAWGLRGVHPVIGSFPVPVYPHVEPPSWTAALAALTAPPKPDDDGYYGADAGSGAPVVLVRGHKRVGKSSAARAALNALLATHARVAWLEADLGQGEFGCGGAVGLWVVDAPVLGPPFTHPRLPERAVYLGELSPQSCADAYVDAVRRVHEHYQYAVSLPFAASPVPGAKSAAVPLVVNTQGWVKGLGEELLREIERVVAPTHVLQFPVGFADDEPDAPAWAGSPFFPGQLDGLPLAGAAAPASATAVFTLEPAPASPLLARYTAADLRVLSIVSYFYARLASAGAQTTWDWDTPLPAAPCWEVALAAADSAEPGSAASADSAAIRRVYIVGEGAAAVVPPDLARALNGHIVALVHVPDAALADDAGADGTDTARGADGATLGPAGALYTRGRPVPDDADMLGLALVRAVRAAPGGLAAQLLAPLPAPVLARANAVVRNGALEMPACGLLDWRGAARGGPQGAADLPFFDARAADVVGGERRRVRRNLQRKGM